MRKTNVRSYHPKPGRRDYTLRGRGNRRRQKDSKVKIEKEDL